MKIEEDIKQDIVLFSAILSFLIVFYVTHTSIEKQELWGTSKGERQFEINE